jgi:hypothetical protein
MKSFEDGLITFCWDEPLECGGSSIEDYNIVITSGSGQKVVDQVVPSSQQWLSIAAEDHRVLFQSSYTLQVRARNSLGFGQFGTVVLQHLEGLWIH